MKLNEIGKMIEIVWNTLPSRYPIVLDQFQIMPNHIHGIFEFKHRVGVSFMKPKNTTDSKIIFNTLKSNRHMGLINQTPTIGHIIRYFKSKCSYQIHRNGLSKLIWQRNYYEHIIRGESDLIRIREYTKNNPINWQSDKLFR